MKNLKPGRIHYQIIVGIFIFALVFGYIAGKESSDQQILQDVFSPYSFLKDIPTFFLFVFIFINNAFKALLTILLGIIFGIYPIYFIFINAELIGLVAALTIKRIGLSATLAGILPHGILELTAIFIAASYGLWLGTRAYRSARYHEPLGPAISSAFRVYYKLILPMLFVAALIEAYITPVLINIFLQK